MKLGEVFFPSPFSRGKGKRMLRIQRSLSAAGRNLFSRDGIALLFILICTFLPISHAFVSLTQATPKIQSTTTVFGVRSALRRGFSNLPRPFRRRETKPIPIPIPAHQPSSPRTQLSTNQRQGELSLTTHYSPAAVTPFQQPNDTILVTSRIHPDESTTTLSVATPAHTKADSSVDTADLATPQASSVAATITKRRRLNLDSDEPLYVLPPNTRSLSRLEQEFRDMLATFSNYSIRDLYALHDPHLRTLVHGVAASGNDAAVYRAFEVLFQDLLPLRVAGRLVYQRLVRIMDKSIQEREEHIAYVVKATGLDARDVEEARVVFFEVASRFNDGAYLTPEQLTTTRMFQTIQEALNFESPHALVKRLDRKGDHKIGLEDFLIGLHECAEDQCQVEENACYALDVIHDLLEEIETMENPMALNTINSSLIASETKELRHIMRYNEMVEIFKGWKEDVPGLRNKKNLSRKWQVVHGCFVGAENQQVVDALRILYVDYAPLRVAAECILSLAASLLRVKPELKR